ncbi:MAG: phage baseplate assembly protein V [Halocynthiibacter sp.]
MAETIDDLRRRISDLERRIGSQSRTGVIADVDAENGLARVRLTDGAEPMLTGWIPWVEASAGANKTHNPPSTGQQVEITSESGDLHDASIQGSLNSDANGRPSSAGDEFVLLSVGAAKISVTAGGDTLSISVGASSLVMTAASVTVSSPRVDLN